MKVLRTVFILIVGMLAGVFLAQYLPRDTTPEVTRSAPSQRVAETTVDGTHLAAPVLTLKGLAAGSLQSTASATVVGPDLVVAAISDFVGAPRLLVESATGQTVAVAAVAASDERYDIAVLRTTGILKQIEVLKPESRPGSLYLGRDVTLLTRNDQYTAGVDMAATQDELGAYHYTVKSTQQMNGEAAAIIDPQTRRLLGLTSRSVSSDIFADAIDSEAINQLIAKVGIDRERTLNDYAAYYFSETTTGRLALLRQLVASEQFSSAIQFGSGIMNLDSYTQKNSQPLLLQAYTGVAKQAIDNSNWRRAIDLISNAEQSTGLTEELRLLRAEAYEAVGDLDRALDDLLALNNPNAYRVRMMVIENAMAAGQDNQSGLSLLERALASDPDFAPYHRLLGEALARQGDMTGALSALESALALDPTLAQELDPLLQRLRARRDTPPLAEVPIQRNRGTLYVNVRINGSNEVFQFLFDTGASYTAITTETALRLGINHVFFGAPVIGLETANGRVYTTTVTLGSIDVGGARVNSVDAVILESMRGVDGLLGQSFLRHFDIDINRTRGVIAFNRRLGD